MNGRGGLSVGMILLSVAWAAADDLCPVKMHPAPKHEPVTLVRARQPAAVIVAPAKPDPLLCDAI